MKKLLLSSIILCSLAAYSQPYFSAMATTQGAGISAGVLAKSGVEISAGYNASISGKSKVPTIFYYKGGFEYSLTKEENNYTLTPAFGMAYWMKKDLSDGKVVSEKDLKLILSLELGEISIQVGYLLTQLIAATSSQE